MPLIALGLNHLTAPVSLREQVAFDADAAGDALRALVSEPGVEEAMILSTCNRTELYVGTAAGAEDIPRAWLNRHHHLTPGKLDEFLYRHDEDDAVRHMFRVATGLDSMVLGEPQILGQVKDAYQLARGAQSLKAPMDRLLQHTFAVAKRVRTDTRIGAHTVSVAFTAVRLAEQVFTDLKQACVLLIGAGDTIELAARHLAEKQARRIIVANRTPETAQELAGRYGGYAIALADLPQHLAEADIVISSTAARQPIVTRAMVEQAMLARKRRPMFMVDIAVPRDIEADVGELPDVYLYGIDDLRQVIDENIRSRAAAAHDAEAIIDLQVDRYMAWRRALTVRNPALDMRQHAEVYRDEVLLKARGMLAHGKSPDEALAFLANTLTNKLLHHPSARLREAALNGDLDLLHAAGRLYGLDEDDDGRATRGE
ncbi:glutamyl-tRNA reductase [Rhodanobacter sp. FDAARGOS 1247]|uniref:glutamyl-tRNA reductase n=1 Tax=Rhodanobacter sp. FDAARGOS 1247 TaxID=2778082 RepID=UPI00194F884C|nr:glutamyl-tRNA reductase [Rhodanobacter sp. FDAARGOS 1247]QRP64757.1 glutamyl-tRNA reductase [Rhodanobacter sp. FDAARGOS 1247]